MEIAVIGNGLVYAHRKEIDRCDVVVRFNLAPQCGQAGTRTDLLCLVNWSWPGKLFAEEPASINSLAQSRASAFVLMTEPSEIPSLLDICDPGTPGDFSPQILDKIVRGRPVAYVSADIRNTVEAELRTNGAPPNCLASSGPQIIEMMHRIYPAAKIRLYGFTHEGWHGHAWDAERRWVDTRSNYVERVAPITPYLSLCGAYLRASAERIYRSQRDKLREVWWGGGKPGDVG